MFSLVAASAQPRRAQAQTQAAPQPASLTAVTVAEAGPGETRLLLTFAPRAPKYSLVRNDSAQPAIAFALSSRAPGVTAPSGPRGLLRSISFDQEDTVLILDFAASGPVRITVTPVGDKAISLGFATPTPMAQGLAARPPERQLPEAIERAPGEDGFELVPLKYADVSEVVGLLTNGLSVKSNDNFTPHEPAFGSSSSGMGGSAAYVSPPPGAEGASQSVGQSVDEAIGVDRRLNAIILKGSPDRIARLKAKIAEFDVPVQSVLLETEFVELDESGARNVGLDFNNTASQIAVATLQTGQFNVAGGNSEHPLTSVALQGAIYAQVNSGHGRIVSTPRVSAQSGSTAKIVTGDALPILTAITLSGVSGVSQQVQYVNVGVTLQIAPRVSGDGFVTSHVFCVISSVTGVSQGYPTISQREASTSATVRDGESFVIGGLTEESDFLTDNKLPGLGSAPFAGDLVHQRTGTRSKTQLYIVVTPHIVKPGDPAAAVPAEARTAR